MQVIQVVLDYIFLLQTIGKKSESRRESHEMAPGVGTCEVAGTIEIS